jgi:hypothetical protein
MSKKINSRLPALLVGPDWEADLIGFCKAHGIAPEAYPSLEIFVENAESELRKAEAELKSLRNENQLLKQTPTNAANVSAKEIERLKRVVQLLSPFLVNAVEDMVREVQETGDPETKALLDRFEVLIRRSMNKKFDETALKE